MPTRRVGGRRGGEAGTNYRGPAILQMFVFLGSIDTFRHIKPSRPSPSHSANDSLSHSVQKFLTSPSLLRGPKNAIHRGTNPLSAALFLFLYMCIQR